MNVLIIPEDPTKDKYVLKPIVEQLFDDLGRRAKVVVLENPRLQGVDEALAAAQTAAIVQQYSFMQLFLTLVDRDGKADRQRIAVAREQEHPGKLFVCLAVEEIEVWMLAVHRHSFDIAWAGVRQDPHPKERFSDPFLKANAPKPDPGPGMGRKWAMRGVSGKWKGMLQACPELGELQNRIRVWLDLNQALLPERSSV